MDGPFSIIIASDRSYFADLFALCFQVQPGAIFINRKENESKMKINLSVKKWKKMRKGHLWAYLLTRLRTCVTRRIASFPSPGRPWTCCTRETRSHTVEVTPWCPSETGPGPHLLGRMFSTTERSSNRPEHGPCSPTWCKLGFGTSLSRAERTMTASQSEKQTITFIDVWIKECAPELCS